VVRYVCNQINSLQAGAAATTNPQRFASALLNRGQRQRRRSHLLLIPMPQRSALSHPAPLERRQVGSHPRRSSPALARLHHHHNPMARHRHLRQDTAYRRSLVQLCLVSLALAHRHRRKASHRRSSPARLCLVSPVSAHRRPSPATARLHRRRRASRRHSSPARLCPASLAMMAHRHRALQERLQVFPARRHSPATARPLQGSAAQASPATARPLQATQAALAHHHPRRAGQA
jgi:hypothetical protein